MQRGRIKIVGGEAVYHCIARIVGGEIVMGDEEKERFRRLMWRLADFCGIEVITYCLMGNHVHLLLRTPPAGELSDEEICRRMVKFYGRKEPWVRTVEAGFRRTGVFDRQVGNRLRARMGDVTPFMQTLKQRFSRWYNAKHNRFGTLWAERFKSLLVEDASESLKIVAMYIDLNPVRAGLVRDPKDYRFCGHAEAMAGNRNIRKSIVGVCGVSTWRQTEREYRCVMMVYAGDSNDSRKASLSREEIRRVLRREGSVSAGEALRLRLRYLTDGMVFGSREFVNEVFAEFRDRFGKHRKTGARKMREVDRSLGGLTTARDLQVKAVS